MKNPVDMIASAPASSYERALGLLLADEQIDAVLVLFVPPIVTEPAAVATAIRQGAAGAEKPVLTCFMGTHGVPEALSSLREGRFPSYAFPEAAAIALSRAVSYGRWLARPAGEVPELADVTPERAQPVLKDVSDEGRWLDASEVNELLGAYGIAMPATRFATTMREAGEAAEAIGFPVALKLMSREITHKSDVSGVVLESSQAAVESGRPAVRFTIRLGLEPLGETG